MTRAIARNCEVHLISCFSSKRASDCHYLPRAKALGGTLHCVGLVHHHAWRPTHNDFLFLQILELLDKMNLSQYKDIFEIECITGEILVECDENVFEKELCITNRLHIIRLMKLVKGQISVMSFF